VNERAWILLLGLMVLWFWLFCADWRNGDEEWKKRALVTWIWICYVCILVAGRSGLVRIIFF